MTTFWIAFVAVIISFVAGAIWGRRMERATSAKVHKELDELKQAIVRRLKGDH